MALTVIFFFFSLPSLGGSSDFLPRYSSINILDSVRHHICRNNDPKGV